MIFFSGGNIGFGVKQTWIQILALLLTYCEVSLYYASFVAWLRDLLEIMCLVVKTVVLFVSTTT